MAAHPTFKASATATSDAKQKSKQTSNSSIKTNTKLACISTAVAALANSAALADNSTLRQQIDLQRQQTERNNKTMTIAVYANRHGVSQGSMDQRTETRFEWRTNANGQRFGIYVPVK